MHDEPRLLMPRNNSQLFVSLPPHSGAATPRLLKSKRLSLTAAKRTSNVFTQFPPIYRHPGQRMDERTIAAEARSASCPTSKIIPTPTALEAALSESIDVGSSLGSEEDAISVIGKYRSLLYLGVGETSQGVTL